MEQQFYLLWPLALLILKRNSARVRFLVCSILTIWLYRVVLVWAGVSENYIYSALEARADHVLIGCLVAILLYSGAAVRLWHSIVTPYWAPPLTFVLLACSVLLTVQHGSNYKVTAGFAVEPILCAILIVQGIAIRPAWLNHHVPNYLGRISYSVYLYHMIAIAVAGLVTKGFPLFVRVPFMVGCSVALGCITYHLVEEPVSKLKSRSSRKCASPVVAKSVGAT